MSAGAVLGKLCRTALLLACVAAATFFGVRLLTIPAQGSGSAHFLSWSGGGTQPDKRQYTPEDVKLMEGMKTAGWTQRSVNDFAKALADWTDEETFHSREDAIARLSRTYEEEGEHAQFLRRTLSASMGEASTRHYGGYCTRRRDGFYDSAVRERQADVFGDQYTVFQAQADYRVSYTVTDGDKLTVGERDRILDAYREQVHKYLDGLSEKQLMEEAAMEKKLQKQLEKLDRQLSTDLMELEGSELVWYSAYGPEDG